MKRYVTSAEIEQVMGMSQSTAHRMLQGAGIKYVLGKPNGGKPPKLYEFSTLPPEVRDALVASWGPELPETTIEDVHEFLRSRKIRLAPDKAADPSVQAKIACARAVHEAQWGETGEVYRLLAEKYGKSGITIRRWVDEVEKWRVAETKIVTMSLSDRSGVPADRIEIPATKKFAPEALAFGLKIYAQNLRSGQKAAYAAMAEEAKRRYWSIGDYTNFSRAVGKIPAGVWDRIRKGAIGFEKDYIPKILRAWLKVPVYSVLCGDQHIFDYLVFDETSSAESPEVITPECYIWMDCTSRYWSGVWPELGHYNSFTVGHSLREACRFGFPGEVFTDWGKPEIGKHTAQILAGLKPYSHPRGPGEFLTKYRDLYDSDEWAEKCPDGNGNGNGNAGADGEGAIRHRRAQAGVPWMKPIENQMNVLERDLADRFLSGYRKRDADAWVNKTRSRELKEARLAGKLVSIEEFLEVFWDVVKSHNNSECKVKEAPGIPIVPARILFNGLMEQDRTVIDDHTLDYLFLPRYRRKPLQSVVRIAVRPGDHRGYYSPSISGLKEYVQVSVDPYDPTAPAIISDEGGRYIDIAEPWNVQDPTEVKGLRDKLIRQAQLRKWWRERVKEVIEGFGLLAAGAADGAGGGDSPSRVVRIGQATRTARKAAAAVKARDELKPAVAKAGKSLEDMYERMKGR